MPQSNNANKKRNRKRQASSTKAKASPVAAATAQPQTDSAPSYATETLKGLFEDNVLGDRVASTKARIETPESPAAFPDETQPAAKDELETLVVDTKQEEEEQVFEPVLDQEIEPAVSVTSSCAVEYNSAPSELDEADFDTSNTVTAASSITSSDAGSDVLNTNEAVTAVSAKQRTTIVAKQNEAMVWLKDHKKALLIGGVVLFFWPLILIVSILLGVAAMVATPLVLSLVAAYLLHESKWTITKLPATAQKEWSHLLKATGLEKQALVAQETASKTAARALVAFEQAKLIAQDEHERTKFQTVIVGKAQEATAAASAKALQVSAVVQKRSEKLQVKAQHAKSVVVAKSHEALVASGPARQVAASFLTEVVAPQLTKHETVHGYVNRAAAIIGHQAAKQHED